jgi:hypothetical protein
MLGLLPMAALSDDNLNSLNQAGLESQSAFAACGGGPIQDGHDLQPTPARDKCLAEWQRSHALDGPRAPAGSAPSPGSGARSGQVAERPSGGPND